jgi:hypothetical protein
MDCPNNHHSAHRHSKISAKYSWAHQIVPGQGMKAVNLILGSLLPQHGFAAQQGFAAAKPE